MEYFALAPPRILPNAYRTSPTLQPLIPLPFAPAQSTASRPAWCVVGEVEEISLQHGKPFKEILDERTGDSMSPANRVKGLLNIGGGALAAQIEHVVAVRGVGKEHVFIVLPRSDVSLSLNDTVIDCMEARPFTTTTSPGTS